jgi:hypothetical protein
MALIGSYILGASGLRVRDSKTEEYQAYWVNDNILPDTIKEWTVDLMKERTTAVFSKCPKLECLVIVDPGIYTNDCINAAFDIAQTYTTKIKIIPALMARFSYVSSKTDNHPRNLKEFLIIVTICRDLCDWHVLQLTANGYDYIKDYLYEKKDFDKAVQTMAKRYCNYKTILLFSKGDEEFVSTINIRCCEKMFVPNWNQMLTEGGIEKGTWMKNTAVAKSKDIIDFASGMSLKLGDRAPFSLVKQRSKLPVKKKHSNFEDIRSFIITREYQHVDYDKITRESCNIFQKELDFEVYKFNLTVQIDKNGQCSIEFQSQKQLFSTPNKIDDSTALNLDDSSANTSLEYDSVEEEPFEKRVINKSNKAVIGYSLFSKTCRFCNPNTGKEEIIKCSSSNELVFTNTAAVNDNSPTKRVEDLLSQIQTPLIDAIVFVHDGRFPIEWLKQARDVARKRTSRIYFISEPMALMLNVVKMMKTSVKENQTLALTFIYGNNCLIYFLKRDSSCYNLIDEAEYNTPSLEKVRNVLLTRRSTDVAVIISDRLSDEIRETFVYKEKSILKVEFIEIENYGKCYVDGALAKAQKVADGCENYFDILQNCGHLKIKIDDRLGPNLCPAYDQVPKTIKKVVSVNGVKELKVIQYKSAFNKREFVLFCNSDIPSSWDEIEITIKLYLAGLFEVIISPVLKPIIVEETPLQQNIIVANSISNFDPSLIPSKTFNGRAKSQEQLHNLGCTFVIFLNEEDCSASIEVLVNEKFYQIKNPSGNIWTPAYVSFVKEKIRIGERAVSDFRKKPEFVVFDMIRLLGRSSHQINPNPAWRFSIAQHPQNQNSIVYEVETYEGRRALTPELALGLYFKALKKLAESISNRPQTRVTLYIPAYYKTIHNNALKEACNFANLSLVQTMQYPRD